MKDIFRSLLMTLAVTISITFAQPVAAATVPQFPLCVNPQAEVKVSYATGTHGIVGDGGTFTGSDTVYNLGNGNFTQCFCPVSGQGIQTDWWKANSLTQAEIEFYKSQGWIFVPTGLVWGLEDVQYLAKNTNYSCLGTGTGTGGASDTNTTVSVGVGNVLGLANTGNSAIITAYICNGLLLVAVGMYLLHQQRG